MKFDKKKVTKVLPFLILGYLFNKESQAFTAAAGKDTGEKIMNGMNNFSTIFHNPLPSFKLTDLLVGVCGAVLIKLAVYDADIYAANNHMNDRENGMRYDIDHITDWYIGWDEYRYFIDDIGHNPYELIAYLSAMKTAFKYDWEIENMINQIYDEMYHLDVESVDEERTHTHETVNEEGAAVTETVVEHYYILNVRMTRKNFEEVVRSKLEEKGVYDIYRAMLETKGNKQYLF